MKEQQAIDKGREQAEKFSGNFGWHIYLAFTVTYTRIVATLIVIGAFVYAFIYHEMGGATGMVLAAVSLFVGRSAVDRFGSSSLTNMIGQDHEVVIRKPQPRNVVEKGNSK